MYPRRAFAPASLIRPWIRTVDDPVFIAVKRFEEAIVARAEDSGVTVLLEKGMIEL